MLLDIDYHPSQGQVRYKNAYLTLLPPSSLNHWVQCFWQLNVPYGKFCYRSVPDNSVDLIFNLNDPEDSFIVTPFSSSVVFELSGPVSYFGIRFRILGHKSLISIPLGEWNTIDDDTRAADTIPEHILHAIYECMEKPLQFNARCKCLSSILLSAVHMPEIDKRLVNYIRYCHKNTGANIILSDKQCSEFGVSARQLRRLSKLHLGLSPREFARVMRFQHMLNLINTTSHKPAWADHFYDQPHFIREFKRISGLTPTEFKHMSVLYNNKRD